MWPYGLENLFDRCIVKRDRWEKKAAGFVLSLSRYIGIILTMNVEYSS